MDRIVNRDQYCIPERPHRKTVYDFDHVEGARGLVGFLAYINEKGYELVTVTQDGVEYTVFFRRPAP